MFQRALKLVKTCPENCDASCHRCLRSFKNKFEHRLLDPYVATALLEFLITGTLPDFDKERLEESATLLYNDLLRQGNEAFEFKLNSPVAIKGKRKTNAPILATAKNGEQNVIALSAPLALNYADDAGVRELQEIFDGVRIVVVNQLLVRGNLPAATREVQQRLLSSKN